MTTPLLVTVDVEGVVEPGSGGNATGGTGESATDGTGEYAVDDRSVDVLDSVLDAFALPATLFVTPAVVRRRTETVAAWREAGHALGLHVHPARLGGESDWLAAYDQSEIETFLSTGIGVFRDHLGTTPERFRAGRWSFSESLLRALSTQGIDTDATHRPGQVLGPYRRHGVTEFPMSVYGHPVVRAGLRASPWDLDGFPLHADATLGPVPRRLALYVATWRVAAAAPYVMVSVHDYDLVDRRMRRQFERYVARLSEWLDATTLADLRWSGK